MGCFKYYRPNFQRNIKLPCLQLLRPERVHSRESNYLDYVRVILKQKSSLPYLWCVLTSYPFVLPFGFTTKNVSTRKKIYMYHTAHYNWLQPKPTSKTGWKFLIFHRINNNRAQAVVYYKDTTDSYHRYFCMIDHLTSFLLSSYE